MVANYTGLWYQFALLPTSQQDGECTTAVYTLEGDGSTISVKNAEYDFNTAEFGGVEGYAKCSKFDDIGAC